MSLLDALEGREREPLPLRVEICLHMTLKGKRCIRESIGDGLCLLHGGGNLETADADARRRLLALRIDSIEALEELLTVSQDDEIRLRAALAVLDRTGHGPKSTLELQKTRPDLAGLTIEELDAEIAELHAHSQAEVERRKEKERLEEALTHARETPAEEDPSAGPSRVH